LIVTPAVAVPLRQQCNPGKTENHEFGDRKLNTAAARTGCTGRLRDSLDGKRSNACPKNRFSLQVCLAGSCWEQGWFSVPVLPGRYLCFAQSFPVFLQAGYPPIPLIP